MRRCLHEIDLGTLLGLIGEWEATTIRRKYQILNAFDKILMNCQVGFDILFVINYFYRQPHFPIGPPQHLLFISIQQAVFLSYNMLALTLSFSFRIVFGTYYLLKQV